MSMPLTFTDFTGAPLDIQQFTVCEVICLHRVHDQSNLELNQINISLYGDK